MTPQNTPAELVIPGPTGRESHSGVIVDSFALYAVRLNKPLALPSGRVRTVIALRRSPGLDSIVSHDNSVVVQLFLLTGELQSLDEFDWANLAFDVATTGALKLREPER